MIEGDLDTSTTFPLFASPAVSAGFAAVFAFPLQHGQTPLGALGLYRDSPGLLSPQELRSAKTLADVAAAYLINAQTRLELQRSADLAHHRSLHDELTGLPNRSLLLDRLGHAFSRSRRTGAVSALLFVDVDGFKQVNDRYGHAAGDDLLVGLTARLRSVLRLHDTLSRLHGDEFVILCEDLQEPDQAQIIAHRIEQALLLPIAVPNAAISITASVGIAFADRDTHSPEQVLLNADAAMYEAKRTGRGRRHTFGSGDSAT